MRKITPIWEARILARNRAAMSAWERHQADLIVEARAKRMRVETARPARMRGVVVRQRALAAYKQSHEGQWRAARWRRRQFVRFGAGGPPAQPASSWALFRQMAEVGVIGIGQRRNGMPFRYK